MKKCFALSKTFGLTPFGPRAPARRGETAGGPPRRDGPLPLAQHPERKRGALRLEADFTWTEWGGEGGSNGRRRGPMSPLLPAPSGKKRNRFFYELAKRDTSRVMKNRLARRTEPYIRIPFQEPGLSHHAPSPRPGQGRHPRGLAQRARGGWSPGQVGRGRSSETRQSRHCW
jgi:hypothetical protein